MESSGTATHDESEQHRTIPKMLERGSPGTSKSWIKWGYTNPQLLKASEESILSAVTVQRRGTLINVGQIIDKNDSKIWTLIVNEHLKDEATPLVLVHGLGAGVALWAKNLDGLAKARTVYAMDVLGFGRSSRTTFSNDPREAERQLVLSIEWWRAELGLNKMILLGHSLGGYLVTSYAISYPQRVAQLILADPWGFNAQPADPKDWDPMMPLPQRVILRVMEPLNPLWSIRLFGPIAPKLIQKIRADLIGQFDGFITDASTKISNYIYHCNVQEPTGESAFHCMMVRFGWAKFPMYERLHLLEPDIPMTVINGAQSWVDHLPTSTLLSLLRNSEVETHVLENAGHHVYTDQVEDFNLIVNRVCLATDRRLRGDGRRPTISENRS